MTPEDCPQKCRTKIEKYVEAFQTEKQGAFEDMIWTLSDREGTRKTNLNFMQIRDSFPEYVDLMKAFIVYMLLQFGTTSKVARTMKDMQCFLRFLADREMVPTSFSVDTVFQYRTWLDAEQKNMSADQRNSCEFFLRHWSEFLRSIEVIKADEEIQFLKPRSVAPKPSRPAPEKAVVLQLDRFFMDFSNEIPTDIRAYYLINRFFPRRSSETPLIPLDGVEIDDELAVIRIPTTKESPGNEPQYTPFPLLPHGQFEEILLQAIEEQREYAMSVQKDIIDTAFQNRLLTSTKNPQKIITPEQMNAYLKKLVLRLDLHNHNGAAPKITLYSLRHANGVELAEDESISTEIVENLFSHQRLGTVAVHYAQPADFDLLSIQENAHRVSQPAVLLPGKYGKLCRQPDARKHEPNLMCMQWDCNPRYIRCWTSCQSFAPDAAFLPEADDMVRTIDQRLAALNELDQNYRVIAAALREQLSAYKALIARAENDFLVYN